MKPGTITNTFASLSLAALLPMTVGAQEAPASAAPMQGFPPRAETQVTLQNYRAAPYSEWAFRNAGAPLHVVMIPREGEIYPLPETESSSIGAREFELAQGSRGRFEAIFADNSADGVAVMKGDKLLYEQYFGDFGPLQQHIWFSMTKSFASTAFGILVERELVNLQASPADYIPELKGSGFERVTIQQVLDHSTAIAFKENYTDPESDFSRYYAPALSMGWMPGAADVRPGNEEIYGVHDFLARFIKPDPALAPGQAFDYNSSNADVLGWLIARISGQAVQDFLQQQVWRYLGAEHDAYIAVDRAYMPVVTGGLNTTLRDALRFGMMVRDRGLFRGRQVIPAAWVDATLALDDSLIARMKANPKYADESWQAYHNMWWVLDADKGEYAAVGIHGQVIYINRSADTVMVWFSSQAGASAAHNEEFRAKLGAARQLAAALGA